MKRLFLIAATFSAAMNAPAQAQAGAARADGFIVNQATLRSQCAQAAAMPPPSRAQGPVQFAEAEWIKFQRGKVLEMTDEKFVFDTPGTPRLVWDKLFEYYADAGGISALQFSTGAVMNGRTPTARKEPYQPAALAVEKKFADDPAQQARLLSALRRSVAGSTPWSAAFISSMFKASSYGPNEFQRTAAHIFYVRSALIHNRTPSDAYRYFACDPAVVKPRPGDLICWSRGGGGPTSWNDLIRRYEIWENAPKGTSAERQAADQRYRIDTHCDIVTTTRTNGTELDSVGGNVSDSVTKTTWTIGADGAVRKGPRASANQSPQFTWMTVLVHRP